MTASSGTMWRARCPIAAGFTAYHRHFKAGDHHRSSSGGTTNGAKVKFYALSVVHS